MLPAQLFEDFLNFHNEQIFSQDCDPIYPVLKYLNANYSRSEQVWLTFLHVSFYHIGSALRVFCKNTLPSPDVLNFVKSPTGTERRAHRNPPNLIRHWQALIDIHDAYGGLDRWIDNFIGDDPKKNWEKINEVLTLPFGNGRWAAYKTAEMLMKINDYPLTATDMGHRNSSGPRQGLQLFFDDLPQGQKDKDIAILDLKSAELIQQMADQKSIVSIETVETSLCDFHNLIRGRYYSGLDIDAMQTQLIQVPSDLTEKAFEARKATIPHKYLGELNNWVGVRKEKQNEYVLKHRDSPSRYK